jgi:DNA-binding SARP family transcriptional activator
MRVHALEARAEVLAGQGRYGEALDCALAALATDPLRESAHRCVVKIHLAEGNWSEAHRQFLQYESIAREELGVTPTVLFETLMFAAETGAPQTERP